MQSLVVLPVMTMSFSMGSINNAEMPHNVLAKQLNSTTDGIVALNKALNPEVEILKAKAEAIDAYFRVHKLPLEGTGLKMATEADKYGLDYRLMPAIAMIETTGGKNLCKKLDEDNNKNPFGWGSCNIGFESFNKAIEVIALNLSGNNPNTAHHYGGKTIKEILEKYNPPKIKPGYAAKVMRVMEVIGDEEVVVPGTDTAIAVAKT